MTPSREVIRAAEVLSEWFRGFWGGKLKGGMRNLWIVKPSSGSKGCGIEIIDRL